jgi:hypothetical protein
MGCATSSGIAFLDLRGRDLPIKQGARMTQHFDPAVDGTSFKLGERQVRRVETTAQTDVLGNVA